MTRSIRVFIQQQLPAAYIERYRRACAVPGSDLGALREPIFDLLKQQHDDELAQLREHLRTIAHPVAEVHSSFGHRRGQRE